jgi:hypothetical protein
LIPEAADALSRVLAPYLTLEVRDLLLQFSNVLVLALFEQTAVKLKLVLGELQVGLGGLLAALLDHSLGKLTRSAIPMVGCAESSRCLRASTKKRSMHATAVGCSG